MTQQDPRTLPGWDSLSRERQIDVLVEWAVFGREVVGCSTCVRIDGAWFAKPGSRADGWICPVEQGPVYVRDCQCESAELEDERYFGHVEWCLAVVHRYTTDWSTLPALIERMAALGWTEYRVQGFANGDVLARWYHTATSRAAYDTATTELAARYCAALRALGIDIP